MSATIYQQINLYQPIFRKQRQIFSALTMLGILGVVTSALLAIYAYGLWHVRTLETEAVLLEERTQSRSARLASVDAGLGEARRQELEQQLERLSTRLAAQHDLLAALRDGTFSDADGFSPQLTALARRHRDGLWLTALAIDGTTGAIELVGRALTADRVAAYLDDLSAEPALSGQLFELVHIERDEQSAGVEFSVWSPSMMPEAAARAPPRRAR